MSEDPETIVRALLAAAGLSPPEPEVQAMIEGYPAQRAAADALHAEAIARFDPIFLPRVLLPSETPSETAGGEDGASQ